MKQSKKTNTNKEIDQVYNFLKINNANKVVRNTLNLGTIFRTGNQTHYQSTPNLSENNCHEPYPLHPDSGTIDDCYKDHLN